MENIKQTIAKNLVELRRHHGYTQLELAEKLNYSDKAVSKWERGESVPDIKVLKEIADLFGVTVDFLISQEHGPLKSKTKYMNRRKRNNRGFITGISIIAVWLLATVLFVFTDMISDKAHFHWLFFLYAIPASFIVWLVFNSIWFNSRRNFMIISLLMWSMLICLCITLLPFGTKMWMILVPGIPGQAIIIMWSRIRTKNREFTPKEVK